MQRIFNKSEPVARLRLGDAGTWIITAGDEYAHNTALRLKKALRLPPATSRLAGTSLSRKGGIHQLCLVSESHAPGWFSGNIVPRILSGDVIYDEMHADILPRTETNAGICVMAPSENDEMRWIQILKLSMVFSWHVQKRGGLLMHGALVKRDETGVILAGPGGTGKSTATRRIPFPWRSLCDDATLVVRDKRGKYWAHPWPTWSHFISGVMDGGCDVQQAVPLTAIFFLSQAEDDRVDLVEGAGRSACLIVTSAEQSSWPMAFRMGQEETGALREERFANSCSLARAVPCYHLRLSLCGAFWEEIEQVITKQRRACA